MDDFKLQDELTNAYDLNDTKKESIDEGLISSFMTEEVVVENVNPLDEIRFLLSPQDQAKLTDEAKSALNDFVQSEIKRVLDAANQISKGSEKVLRNNIQDAVAKQNTTSRSNISAIGFILIGGVISQAIGAAINLKTDSNYGVIIAVAITLLGVMLAFKKK